MKAPNEVRVRAKWKPPPTMVEQATGNRPEPPCPSGIGGSGSTKLFPQKSPLPAPSRASLPPGGARYLFGDGNGKWGWRCRRANCDGHSGGRPCRQHCAVMCLTPFTGRSTTLCTARHFSYGRLLYRRAPRGRTEAIADARYNLGKTTRLVARRPREPLPEVKIPSFVSVYKTRIIILHMWIAR